MTNNERNIYFDESSPSVQYHLGVLQGVINRMAANSSQCKAYCITIVSAIIVVVADKSNPEFAWIALLPVILFMLLDVYYLALEIAFRDSYSNFVRKLHDCLLVSEDFYSVNIMDGMFERIIKSLKSFSIWIFYIGIAALIAITRYVVLE